MASATTVTGVVSGGGKGVGGLIRGGGGGRCGIGKLVKAFGGNVWGGGTIGVGVTLATPVPDDAVCSPGAMTVLGATVTVEVDVAAAGVDTLVWGCVAGASA